MDWYEIGKKANKNNGIEISRNLSPQQLHVRMANISMPLLACVLPKLASDLSHINKGLYALSVLATTR
jgi:hypothetical protein